MASQSQRVDMTSESRQKKIIHVDMDAYFAAIEQRDHPEYRGKPVIVGGRPNSRGVVCTASYEARRFGVRSAMASSQAYRQCPHGIFVSPRFEVYRDVSREIMSVFREFTDCVEPLSLDEAYLDVTENKLGYAYATEIAKEIKLRIAKRTELTASAGVAPNKFLAKIASDMNKPNGLTVITPERVSTVLSTLPIRAVPGVGPVTEKKMLEHGITTTNDILRFTEEELCSWFGKSGRWFFHLARGRDDRVVESSHERKSIGAEETFAVDLDDPADWEREVKIICKESLRRLTKRSLFCRTVTLKATFTDFQKITRSRSLSFYSNDVDEIEQELLLLLQGVRSIEKPVRLLGVSLSNLSATAIVDVGETRLSDSREQLSFPWVNAL